MFDSGQSISASVRNLTLPTDLIMSIILLLMVADTDCSPAPSSVWAISIFNHSDCHRRHHRHRRIGLQEVGDIGCHVSLIQGGQNKEIVCFLCKLFSRAVPDSGFLKSDIRRFVVSILFYFIMSSFTRHYSNRLTEAS